MSWLVGLRRAAIRLDRRWAARWIGAPAVAALLLATRIDPGAAPVVGRDRLTAVLLLDGQAYFGRLADSAVEDSLELRDVYYFQDARQSSLNQSVGLVRRGSEAHRPSDGMVLRRDKVLAIEAVGPASQVATAIAMDRSLRDLVAR